MSGTGAGSSSTSTGTSSATCSRSTPKKRSLYIDYRDVYAFGKAGVRMAQELIENPGKVLEDVRDAVRAQQLARGKGAKEPEVNIRFTNLPVRLGAREIRSEHINRFVSVEGILRKTTEVRPRITEAVFRCPGGHLTRKAQEFGMFVEPDGCATEGCTYRKLTLVPKRSSFVDAQKLRIQESPEGLRGGEQPQTIDVDVTDDITGTVAPGDRVVINGILRSQQRINHGNKSTFFDIHLEANSIEVGEKEFEEVSISDKDEEAIQALSNDPEVYGKITRSIAPTIYGNEEVKEAIALQLFGGIMKSMPDGSHLRGDIHCLLIGDPGIAKSQILRYVVRLSPRGIYTSGQSSTQAGLTATAVKDEFGDGRWTLEAGALVLADMGIAAVDEMDKMQKDDRSALHEAMEQQSISVAKAGITATLKSRCALLGAANPKLGRFDEYADIGEQINMPPSLLSRFDLIFILADKPDHKRDEAIAEHILKAHGVGELIAQHARDPIDGVDDAYIQRELAPVTPEIEPAMLRKYVAYAKRTCFPILSPEAKDVLVGYYMRLRDLADSNKPVPVTARQARGARPAGRGLGPGPAREDDHRAGRRAGRPDRRHLPPAGGVRPQDRDLRHRQGRDRDLEGQARPDPRHQGGDPRERRRLGPGADRPDRGRARPAGFRPRGRPEADRQLPPLGRGDGAEERRHQADLKRPGPSFF